TTIEIRQLVLKKSSKKFQKHMLSYQMMKKGKDMTLMVMLELKRYLEGQKQTLMKSSKILGLEVSETFSNRYLQPAVVSVAQVVATHLALVLASAEGEEKDKIFFMILNCP